MMHVRRIRRRAGSDSGIPRSFLPCLTLAAHRFFRFKNVYLVEFAFDRHDSLSIFHVNIGVDPECKELVPLPNVFLNTQYQQNVFRIAFDPASQANIDTLCYFRQAEIPRDRSAPLSARSACPRASACFFLYSMRSRRASTRENPIRIACAVGMRWYRQACTARTRPSVEIEGRSIGASRRALGVSTRLGLLLSLFNAVSTREHS